MDWSSLQWALCKEVTQNQTQELCPPHTASHHFPLLLFLIPAEAPAYKTNVALLPQNNTFTMSI